jgi:hypothetical protein
MRKLLILAAVAALSTACHNRSEDETGAAPDRTDATVTATDSASIPTDSTMGQRPEATDTSMVRQDDTTAVGTPTPVEGDSAMIHHQTPDSSGMGAMGDSTGMGHDMSHDSTAVQGDSAMMNSTVPDTTAAQ